MSAPAAEPAPLLHVGYHKTGTTWLQTGLFASPARGFTRPWRSGPIRAALVRPTAFEFDSSRAAAAFADGLREAAAAGLVPVVSDERLSGSPHAGGYDSGEIARRLHRTFPGGRVLIVVREQRRAILSTYRQYVRDGGVASLAGWLHPRNPDELPQLAWSHWEYHHLIGLYRELFGAERVLVLAFETLAGDDAGFGKRIARFAGARGPGVSAAPPAGSEYRALGALTTAIKRHANRWLVRSSLSPGAPLYVKDHERRFEAFDRLLPRALSSPLERRWRRRVEQAVGERYAASNRATAELAGLDLAALGYPVAEGA
jgi:hypothetical protein